MTVAQCGFTDRFQTSAKLMRHYADNPAAGAARRSLPGAGGIEAAAGQAVAVQLAPFWGIVRVRPPARLKTKPIQHALYDAPLLGAADGTINRSGSLVLCPACSPGER